MNISKLVRKCVFVAASITLSPMLSAMKVNPDNAAFVELQKRIDSGDLAAVKQQVEAHNLKGRLNEEYRLECVQVSGKDIWEYQPEFAQAKKHGVFGSRTNLMSYVLSRYDTAKTNNRGPKTAAACFPILRYFLEECNATFVGVVNDQEKLVTSFFREDFAAIKLFIQFGMLQLPKSNLNLKPFDLAAMVRAEVDEDGNPATDEFKAFYKDLLPILEARAPAGTKTIFTPRNMMVGALAAIVGGLLIKKAYDWCVAKPEDDEQESETTDTAQQNIEITHNSVTV